MFFRSAASVAAVALLLALAGCGAGLVGGVLASDRGRRPGPPVARAPSLTIDVPTAAFYGQEGHVRHVFINDYVASAGTQFRVLLRVPGVEDRRNPAEPRPELVLEQRSPTLLSVEGGLTRIGFLLYMLELPPALAAVSRSPTGADLPAMLMVLADGREVAPAAPFTVLRQPTARLVPSRGGAREEFVAVTGGSRFTLQVSGARSRDAADFAIAVATPDPTGASPFVTRTIEDVTIEPVAGSADVRVSGAAPPSTFLCQIFASVLDRLSGLSTPVGELYYEPVLDAVSPRSASTDGGTLMLLSGTGLLPLRFAAAGQPGEPDYDQITLWIEKGGRRRQVEPALIRRRPPSLNQLVFEVPPSPDARPGAAEIVLRAALGGTAAEARAGNLFLYGDAAPVFGPRGTALTARPDDVAFGRIEDLSDGLDAVMGSAVGGLPRVHLFVSTDNGMLRRFGAPITAGELADPGQRRPGRVWVTDLDRDGQDDVLVLNRGDGGPATHTALRGQVAPAPPLRALGGVISGAAEADRVRTGDLDRNGTVDFVVLAPRANGTPPEVYLSTGTSASGPIFARTLLTQVGATHDVHEVADLDGDGALDLAFARAGADPSLRTLYGRGDGSFVEGQILSLRQRIPNYTEDGAARAVGLHACGPGPARALVLVLAGLGGSGTPQTPPSVVVLPPAGPRQHGPPAAASTIGYPTARQVFGTSMAADLDDDGTAELVVANTGVGLDPTLRLYRWENLGTVEGFRELQNGVDPGVEPMFNVTALAVGRAVAPGEGTRTSREFKTVMATHQFVIGFLSEEYHVSTLLVDRAGGPPRLVAPDAAVDRGTIRGIAVGRFGGQPAGSRALDVAIAASDAPPGRLEILGNDGIGGLAPARAFSMSLLAPTIATLPVRDGDAVLFLDAGREVGAVLPGSRSVAEVPRLDLTPYLPEALRRVALDETSRIAVGDVDGDGVADAVVLLVLGSGAVPLEERGHVLLLLGDPAAGPLDLPFHVPDAMAVGTVPAHGDARSLALADFALESGEEPTRREVAVAVGGAGNHVRFYRFVGGGAGRASHRLRRSFADPGMQALIAGERPEFVAATDLDGNGTGDLAVVSTADRQLNLFVNAALPGTGGEVDIAAFRPVAGSVPPPDGLTNALLLHDVNGDGIPDAVVAGETVIPQPKREVQVYLGTGTGLLTNPVSLAPIRTGDLFFDRSTALPRQRSGHLVLAVGHLNGDSDLDMVIGWDTIQPGDRGLRVLFGGVR